MASSMAMSTVLFFFFFFFFFFSAIVKLSTAAVHTVGDAEGWTIITPNYTAWAAKQTFHVGDTLLFKYNKQLHNVVKVKKSDYDACTLKSALATYATGNDSVPIETAGTHYYLCGIPGHCLGGQKVEITVEAADKRVKAPASSPGPSPSASVSAARAPQGETTPTNSDTGSGTGASVPAPGPKASEAPAGHKGLGSVVFNVVLVAVYAILG